MQLDFWTLHLIWYNVIYNKTSTEIICNKHCGYLTSLNVLMFTSLCRDELLLFTSGLRDIWLAYVPNNRINCVKGYIELVNYQLSGSVMQNVFMGSRIIHQSKINIRHNFYFALSATALDERNFRFFWSSSMKHTFEKKKYFWMLKCPLIIS